MSRPSGLLLLLLLGGILFSAIRPVWAIDPDAAAYVRLGWSMAEDGRYALDGSPHAKYPPGWPSVVALLTSLKGATAFGTFHTALVCALLLGVVLSGSLVRRLGYSPGAALVVAALVGLSQTFFDLSVHYLRSEPLFLLTTLAALLASLQALRPGARMSWTFGAGLLVIAAVAVRLAGVSLLAVPGLVLLLGPIGAEEPTDPADAPATPSGNVRLRAILILIMGLAAVGAWQWRAGQVLATVPDAPDYGREFTSAEPRDLTKVVRLDNPGLDASTMLRRIAGNADVMARAMGTLLTNVDRAAEKRPPGLALLALVLLGWCRMAFGASSTRRAAAAYVGATLVLYAIWPFNQQERFYAPLLPLLLIMAGEGLALAWRATQRIAGSAAGRAALLLAGAAALTFLALQTSRFPTVLGRWSTAYAGLLAVVATGLAVLGFVLLRRRGLPDLRPGLIWVLPVLFFLPLAHRRFIEWPRQVRNHVTHRAEHPRSGLLTRLDVPWPLEDIAVFLAENTPEDAVVMTDVPKMMAVMSGRRCIPFVYAVDPPQVVPGEATHVYYTGELEEAYTVLEQASGDWEQVLRLRTVEAGDRSVTPTVFSLGDAPR